MPDRIVRIVPNRRGIQELREDLARGAHAVGLDAETETKREAPVRGGYRSFRPGTRPIGGTLRRSYHTATYLDGRLLFQHSDGGQANAAAWGVPSRGIVVLVGSNLGYAAFVELGTSKMPARPHLGPGLELAGSRAPATMARAIGRRGR